MIKCYHDLLTVKRGINLKEKLYSCLILGFIVTPDHLIEAAFQLYRKQWIESGMKIAHPEDIPEEYKNGDCLKFEVLLKQLKNLNLDIENFEIDGFHV
ncbi:hypothetical protein FZC71_04095 [Bacillus subtilis]|nr:hypothetical protein FZC71_04095 [Bacillus subtilis]